MITENGHVIGQKVGTEKRTLLIDRELITFYYAKIEVNGRMMDVKVDGETARASTRNEARKKAIAARDRILRGGSGE